MNRVFGLILAGAVPCAGLASSLDHLLALPSSRIDSARPGGQPAQPPLLIAGILPKDGEAMYELEFWNSIKDSTHAEDYEAYLKAYPDGRFAPLARVRLERYRKTGAPETTEAAPKEPAVDVKPINERYIVTTNTNVRSGPSTNADIVGELKAGERVDVTGLVADRKWLRVNPPQGGVGYVYAPLLKKPEPEPVPAPREPPPSKPPAVAQTSASGASGGRDCPECPEMVTISPGSFLMGDNKGDRSEKPAHRVTIKRPFALGKYEVTVAQWQACVDAGACEKATESVRNSDNAPIRDVSWGDAQDYVDWLSRVTGQSYRLPTEAEWEFAARAGTTTTYWWGNQMMPGKANCKDCGGTSSHELPADVGTLEPNPFGLHDMNGNVWEWVDDCWHRNYEGAPSDGRSWDDTGCTVRVIRSGSWRNDKTYVHSASRFKYDAYVRYVLNGFRVAKTLK